MLPWSVLQVIAVAKSSDLVLMVLDASKVRTSQSKKKFQFCIMLVKHFSAMNQYECVEQSEGHRQILTRELEAVGLRLNKRPPQVFSRL